MEANLNEFRFLENFQGEQYYNEIYGATWYHMSAQEKKALSILLASAKSPRKFTYMVGTLNIESFMKVSFFSYQISDKFNEIFVSTGPEEDLLGFYVSA